MTNCFLFSGSGCRRLVSGAVPDRNLPVLSCTTSRTNTKDQQKARKKRALQRERAGEDGERLGQEVSTADTSGIFMILL